MTLHFRLEGIWRPCPVGRPVPSGVCVCVCVCVCVYVCVYVCVMANSMVTNQLRTFVVCLCFNCITVFYLNEQKADTYLVMTQLCDLVIPQPLVLVFYSFECIF